ncbi:MAG: hypothetical protein H8E66_08695 [Planctomycetes bacterium]|nr:hypothetical protein [Planctomycetota bacterium]
MSGPVPIIGHRFGTRESAECLPCEDRQRLQDYAHRSMPYMAGPFMHNRADVDYAAQQATIQPPHSKFHPVPTRPVFETRMSYHPPQPIGVHLVPVPNQGTHSIMPQSPRSHDVLAQPPRPPLEIPETGPRDFDDSDTFMLPPPGN